MPTNGLPARHRVTKELPMSISQHQTGRDNPLLRVPKDHRLEYRDFISTQMKLPETDTRWKSMCESLQRQAHGFDAAFASAFAHMIATPKNERLDPREAPLTAFIFVDDPNDSNPYGHVVGKWGKGDGSLESIPVATNDVSDNEAGYDPGNVTVVPLGWFPAHWGDSIQFATTWFGGTEIPTIEPQTGPQDTERWVKAAITRAEAVVELMVKARQDNDGTIHPRHEKAITREIQDQRQIIADLRKLLP